MSKTRNDISERVISSSIGAFWRLRKMSYRFQYYIAIYTQSDDLHPGRWPRAMTIFLYDIEAQLSREMLDLCNRTGAPWPVFGLSSHMMSISNFVKKHVERLLSRAGHDSTCRQADTQCKSSVDVLHCYVKPLTRSLNLRKTVVIHHR